jgi:hypothetical protein
MTRDDIIRLMDWHPSAKHTDTDGLLARIEKVAEAAAAAEREACAKVAEKMLRHYTQAVTGVPEAIRARGQA